MFTDEVARTIRALTFDPNAQATACLIPLGSIHWRDELPPLAFILWKKPDRDALLRLFAIRINYWNNGEVSAEDESFWRAAENQFPNWPLFRRMHLSEAHRTEHERVQEEAAAFLENALTLKRASERRNRSELG